MSSPRSLWIGADASNYSQQLFDLQLRPLTLVRGAAVRFHVALFDGRILEDLTQWGQVHLQIKQVGALAADPPLASDSKVAGDPWWKPAVTAVQFHAKEDSQIIFQIPDTQMAGISAGSYQLLIWTVGTGSENTKVWCATRFRITDAGVGNAGPPVDSPEQFYTKGEVNALVRRMTLAPEKYLGRLVAPTGLIWDAGDIELPNPTTNEGSWVVVDIGGTSGSEFYTGILNKGEYLVSTGVVYRVLPPAPLPGAGEVTEAMLAANAVTEAKLADLGVTTGKIAANAVTEAKLAAPARAKLETVKTHLWETADILDVGSQGQTWAGFGVRANEIVAVIYADDEGTLLPVAERRYYLVTDPTKNGPQDVGGSLELGNPRAQLSAEQIDGVAAAAAALIDPGLFSPSTLISFDAVIDPEGVIVAEENTFGKSPSGSLWFKVSGFGDTGWVEILTSEDLTLIGGSF